MGAPEIDAWTRLVPDDVISQPIVASSVNNWGAYAKCIAATKIPDHTTLRTDDDGRVIAIGLHDLAGLPAKRFDHAMFVRAGWPCWSMSGAFWRDDVLTGAGVLNANEMLHEKPTYAVRPVSAKVIERPSRGTRVEYRTIPLRPIWPGFAINTVFYAVVLWLLFAGPFVLRRRWRIRRGLCPKCAYDLRGTPKDATVCPECGAAVSLALLGGRGSG